MAEEKKEETTESLSFKTADELSTFLMDLQGQIGNMQQTIDKLAPVEENTEEGKEVDPETPSEEEISEVDQLLQTE